MKLFKLYFIQDYYYHYFIHFHVPLFELVVEDLTIEG